MKEKSLTIHMSWLFSALSVSLKSKILAKSLKRGSREIFDPRNRDTKGFLGLGLGRWLVADVGPLVLDQY